MLLNPEIAALAISSRSVLVAINVLPSQDKAMKEKARADVSVLEQALESYRLDMFAFPPTEAGLQALVTPPAGAQVDRYREGGYIRRLPKDPWGNPYQYRAPGVRGAIDIFSFGADGREGGEGKDADIGNWS
ncbi:MAG: type II secretion system protein GspG [Caulobacter sp. 35-67-4]|nr:MAG: type II secretion system protein GspG [Caulobacter sp. 35-67-4]